MLNSSRGVLYRCRFIRMANESQGIRPVQVRDMAGKGLLVKIEVVVAGRLLDPVSPDDGQKTTLVRRDLTSCEACSREITHKRVASRLACASQHLTAISSLR